MTAGYGDRVALTDVDLEIATGLAAGGDRARTARARARCSRRSPACCGRSRARSRSSAAPAGCRRKRIAYVPQAELVDWAFPVTVGDVVMMGRVPADRDRPLGRAATDREAVAAALETVRMADTGTARSGPCRAASAAGCSSPRRSPREPDLYLLDEPVTGVDVTTQEDLMRHPRGRVGCRPDGRRDDPRPRQRGPPLPPGGVRQRPDRGLRAGRPGPGPDLLAATYGGHVIVLPAGDRTIIDDAHHHDDARRRRAALPRGRPLTMLDFLLGPMAYGFMQRGLVAAILVGIVCAVMGAFVVLRGLAFIGDAVSHAAFPGLVIAYHARDPAVHRRRGRGGRRRRWPSAAVARRGALRFDTAVGVLFAGTFAFGIVLFSTIQGYVTDLFGYLLGNVLGITVADIVQIAVLGAIVLVVVAVLRKELLYASFDPLGAAASGLPVVPLDYLLLGAARRDDRGQHPGGRDHHGRGDARHAGRDRRSSSSTGSGTWS